MRRDVVVDPRRKSRSALALSSPANQQSVHGAEVSTPCGAISTGAGHFFRPLIVGVVDVWKVLGCVGTSTLARGNSRARPFMYPDQSVISRSGCDFLTMLGGFDPGDNCFRPRIVGVVNVEGKGLDDCHERRRFRVALLARLARERHQIGARRYMPEGGVGPSRAAQTRGQV